MEKRTAAGYICRFYGLLKSALLGRKFFAAAIAAVGVICLSRASAVSQAAYINSLSLKTSDEYVFTSSNTTFSVDIARELPSSVDIYVNAIPDGVDLVSINKETYIPPVGSSDTSYGTHIDIVVRFSKEGDIKLFAADLITAYGYFKLPFERVHVYANITVLKPELLVTCRTHKIADNTINVNAGEEIVFNVCVKYASAVKSIKWDIPESSIFVEEKRYDIANSDHPKEGFSADAKPVSTFRWTPLVSGVIRLPPISVEAVSYSGVSSYLSIPEIKAFAKKRDSSIVSEKMLNNENQTDEIVSSYLENAFAIPVVEEAVNPESFLAQDKLEELARLYKAERYSLPVISKASRDRKSYEESHGLSVVKSIPKVPVFILLLVVTVSFLVVTVVLIFVHQFPYASVFLLFGLFLMVSTIIYGIKVKSNIGVFTGDVVYPIPEVTTVAGFPLQAGSLVKVLKKAGVWYYISINDTNGWILHDNVILVN